jgi:hypothetical protein
MADSKLGTVTSATSASAVAVTNLEGATVVATDTSAATASGLANLAPGVSTAVGIMSAEKAAAPAGRVDDTGSKTSPSGAKENLILA